MNNRPQKESPFDYYDNSHIPGKGFNIGLGKALAANRAKRARDEFFEYVDDLLEHRSELCTEARFRSISVKMADTGQSDVLMHGIYLVTKISRAALDCLPPLEFNKN